jgi:hypothetical protein
MDRRKARIEIKHNFAIKTKYVRTSPRLKIPRVLVRLDHVACFIVNALNRGVKDWELIADNLSKDGWTLGCISSTDHGGRQSWVVAAKREDADALLSARMQS